jgi:hypothetical protein
VIEQSTTGSRRAWVSPPFVRDARVAPAAADDGSVPFRLGTTSRRLAWCAAIVVVLLATVLRAAYLDIEPLWVDEAESSLNALTILDRGYPGADIGGMPIYENMLVREWPGHPEYEFRDISYSDRGLAVYHAWLPLYAVAASLHLSGIRPPPAHRDWRVDVDVARFRAQTIAARLPSLLFGVAFVALMGLAAVRMAGSDAGLAALTLTGLSVSVLETTFQARYYAPMLAFGAAGAFTLWNVARRGSVRDHVAHGVVLVLLFHTNLFGLVNLVAASLVAVALAADRATAARRMSAVLAGLGLAAAPWILATGYLEHLRHMPSGRFLVTLPDDLVQYVARRLHYLAVFVGGSTWLILALVRHGTALPVRLREPWRRHRWQYMILGSWMVASTATYFLLSPPASLFPQRLSIALFVPGFLFMALSLADAARTVSRHLSVWIAPAMAVAYLAASGLLVPPSRDPQSFEKL